MIEMRVLSAISTDEGSTAAEVAFSAGVSSSQARAALQRLRAKGLATCGRWRETSVWWKTPFSVAIGETPFSVAIGEQIYIPRRDALPLHRDHFVSHETRRAGFGKPWGGLWTSTYATSASRGWEWWCKAEGMQWLSEVGYLLTPRADANVFTIDGPQKAAEFIDTFCVSQYPNKPEFDDLKTLWANVADAYDGVRITAPYHPEIRFGRVMAFYSWDCESTWWSRWAFEEDAGRPVEIDPYASVDDEDDDDGETSI